MKEALKYYTVPSLTKMIELFETDLSFCSKNIQDKVESIIKKSDKNQLLKDLLKKYNKIKQIDEDNIVDLFLFEYDTKNKPYLTGIYLKARKELLRKISPYEILQLEAANKSFPEFYANIGVKQKERFLKILHKMYSLEDLDNMDHFFKLISDEKWYTLSDKGFNDVFLAIDENVAKVTPKIMKKILYDFKEKRN